jgi:hypothetical protein
MLVAYAMPCVALVDFGYFLRSQKSKFRMNYEALNFSFPHDN